MRNLLNYISKGIITISLLLVSLSVFADDVIVLRNGDIINGTVTEVTTNEIKYKKTSNPNGPVYTIEKESVLSIKYANGETDKFDSLPQVANTKNNSQTTTSSITKPKQSTDGKAVAAEDNEEEKSRYAILPRINIKQSNKMSKNFFPIMAFTDASVISTDEIIVFIYPEAVEYYDGGWRVKIGYAINIVNKTDSPIYIDRARCFRRFNDYDTRNYFDNKQVTVTNGDSFGGGLGIGAGHIGMGFGGASSSSSTESYGVDRILAIGPHSKANLIDYKFIRLSEKKAKFKTVSDIEYWGFNLNKKSDLCEGEIRSFSESNTPYSNAYFITYSHDMDFSNSYSMEFELYAKYLVGGKFKDSTWAMMSPESRIVKEYQEVVPDFWTTSLSIVGMPGVFK